MTLWVATDHGTGQAIKDSSLHDLMENVKTLCLYHRHQISDFTFRTEPDKHPVVNAMMDTGLGSLRANTIYELLAKEDKNPCFECGCGWYDPDLGCMRPLTDYLSCPLNNKEEEDNGTDCSTTQQE